MKACCALAGGSRQLARERKMAMSQGFLRKAAALETGRGWAGISFWEGHFPAGISVVPPGLGRMGPGPPRLKPWAILGCPSGTGTGRGTGTGPEWALQKFICARRSDFRAMILLLW